MTSKDQIKTLSQPQRVPVEISPYKTVIKVLGAGGAGCNTILHLMKQQSKVIEAIAINSDAQSLLEITADRKILIGRNLTAGLGAGGDPMIGERAAEESKDIIDTSIKGTDLLFLTCGLGGGTGTGAIPVVGELARKQGILTAAVLSMPFSEEGIVRWENAQIGLEKIRKTVDTLIVLKNDKLLELFPDIPLKDAFHGGDEILINSLMGISDIVLKNGFINLDFADVSVVMRDGPNVVIGLGESNSENRVDEAICRAISHPMMDSDISGAQSALVHVAGGPEMTLKEARKVIHDICQRLDPNARIIWGASIEKSLRQTIRVMLMVTGLKETAIITRKHIENIATQNVPETVKTDTEKQESGNQKSIFDIKESILSSKSEKPRLNKPINKPIAQTTLVFYKIFEEEAAGDLKRFDRAIHFLRENLENRKALLDSKQACKLLLASAQMFGFDEIAQLLSSIEELLSCVQSKEIQLTPKILDSITLAMEMVVDLVENRSDGRGETGYVVDRLKEFKEDKLASFNPNGNLKNL